VCSLHQWHLARQFAQRMIRLSAGQVRCDGYADGVDDTTTAALYETAFAAP